MCLYISDYRTIKCVYTATVSRRVPRCVPCDGANGRKSLSSYSNGPGSWADVLSPIPDAMRYKASAFGWNYS